MSTRIINEHKYSHICVTHFCVVANFPSLKCYDLMSYSDFSNSKYYLKLNLNDKNLLLNRNQLEYDVGND